MPVSVDCGNCSKHFHVADQYAGMTIKCPDCKESLKVPGEKGAAAIKATCDACESAFRAPLKYAGKRVKCPKCGQGVTVPEATAPQSAAPEAAVANAAEPDAAEPQAVFPGGSTRNRDRHGGFGFAG